MKVSLAKAQCEGDGFSRRLPARILDEHLFVKTARAGDRISPGITVFKSVTTCGL